MKRKRHTAEQIIAKLRQWELERACGATLADIGKRLKVREKTHLRWRWTSTSCRMWLQETGEPARQTSGGGICAEVSRVLEAPCLPVVVPAPIAAALHAAGTGRRADAGLPDAGAVATALAVWVPADNGRASRRLMKSAKVPKGDE
jgi:hypothetical protein